MSKLLLASKTAALCLVAMGSVASVQAQTYTPAGPVASMFTPGTSYVALNAGVADLSRPISGLGQLGGGQQGQAYAVALGNYMAGQNYGVEIAYNDFGSVSRYGGRTSVDGFTLSLLGRLPISSNFNLMGKVGTTYGRTDVSTDAANQNLSGTEQGFDWSYGIGGELVLSPQWSATLQYSEHYVKYHATGNERVSSTLLGVRYYY